MPARRDRAEGLLVVCVFKAKLEPGFIIILRPLVAAGFALAGPGYSEPKQPPVGQARPTGGWACWIGCRFDWAQGESNQIS